MCENSRLKFGQDLYLSICQFALHKDSFPSAPGVGNRRNQFEGRVDGEDEIYRDAIFQRHFLPKTAGRLIFLPI